MTHIKKIISAWTGSEKTEELVREQIRQRWGDSEAEEYDARYSVRPLRAWHQMGMRIKDQEFKKPLRSFVLLKAKSKKDGEEDEDQRPKRYFKTIFLYHAKQTELVKK